VADPLAHLALLARLLDIARPSAHFPDARRVTEWVLLLQRPWTGRTTPKLELHPSGGFPTRRSLLRLLERRELARAFFAAHRTRPPRSSDQLNAALAASELWAPQTEAKLVAADGKSRTFLVVHDRFHATEGTLQRFTLQLVQRGKAHVRVERGTACSVTPAFVLAVDQACDADTTAAALRVEALEGVEVLEAVKGELGPCVTAFAGALGRVAPDRGEGVLSLLLERIGRSVGADHLADLWATPDPLAQARIARKWKLSRERRLVCTPGLEPTLQALAAARGMLVRSR
jgi:hypothetical protein